MYAVILAGGGGTRLWPLSRPERPKPFLPLLGDETLFQRTVARLAGPELHVDDVTVVTDRRYEPIVRAQRPDVTLLVEPMGRNTAAAVALATLAIDRDDDEIMVVLPADHTIADESRFRTILAAAGHLATGAFDIADPLVTLGIRPDRPATQYGYLIPDLRRGGLANGLQAYPLHAFEEKPRPARAEELIRQEGVAWNAGMFLWRRGAIRAALERYTGLLRLLGPAVGAPRLLDHAYEQLKPVSIDYAVMESAAADGHVVTGAMDVGWSDLGSWSALLEALGVASSGEVVQAGETVEVGEGDLVVRRTGGRISAVAPLERGSMTATQPIAVLHGARERASTIEALLARCSDPEG